jgi:hypothetical protein
MVHTVKHRYVANFLIQPDRVRYVQTSLYCKTQIRPKKKKKNCVFPVTQPTVFFLPSTLNFFLSISKKFQKSACFPEQVL